MFGTTKLDKAARIASKRKPPQGLRSASMPLSVFSLAALMLGLISVYTVFAPDAHAQSRTTRTVRPIDLFDRVTIEFTAEGVKSIGTANIEPPSDTVAGKVVLFMPKVRETAEGFWISNQTRFSNMSIKTGEYSFPMSGCTATVQYIDNRPVKLIIGRSPGGQAAIAPGSTDFALRLQREARSRNPLELEFDGFEFSLFGQKGAHFRAESGKATIKTESVVPDTSKNKNGDPGLGFSIGNFTPN